MLNSATVPSSVTDLSSTYVPANEWCPYAATAEKHTATDISKSSLDFILSSPSRVLALWDSAIHTLLCQSRARTPWCLRVQSLSTKILINCFHEHLRRPGR